MKNILFVDIETVPSNTLPPIENFKAPANYKDAEKIREYRENAQFEAYKKQALNSMQGQIICIGYAYNEEIYTITLQPEHDCLDLFSFRLKEIVDEIRESPTFVGWNIATFDLPWLWRKAVQYNLSSLRSFIPKDNRNLYIDLMKVWASEYRDYVSLDNCAKFLGIEHEGGSGSDVFDWWQAGEIDKITYHCQQDIKTTMEIYERICG
jgi:predicted PolB exonuclease-like 3'-5' exonuclease